MRKITTNATLCIAAAILLTGCSGAGKATADKLFSAGSTGTATTQNQDSVSSAPAPAANNSESKTALSRYQQFLARDTISWDGGDMLSASSAKFMVEDINSDGVVDLIVQCPGSKYGSIGIFSIIQDHTAEICYGESLGWYYPGTGIFVTIYGDGRSKEHPLDEVYMYQKPVAEEEAAGNRWAKQVGEHKTKVDGEEVWYWLGIRSEENAAQWSEASCNATTEDLFNSRLQELIGSVEPVYLTENWIDNTEENRNAYLG